MNTTETTLLTPYEVAKVVNEMLAARGLKEIPTQMCYNYIKKGYIVSSAPNRVSPEDASEWGEQYVAKRVARGR